MSAQLAVSVVPYAVSLINIERRAMPAWAMPLINAALYNRVKLFSFTTCDAGV